MKDDEMKAIVVEDSRLAREGLVRMLTVFPDIQVVGTAENVTDALLLVAEYQPELIFFRPPLQHRSLFNPVLAILRRILFRIYHA